MNWQSQAYQRVIAAVDDFNANRLEERSRGSITSARLYRNALRSLDVYGPTKALIEAILEEPLSERDAAPLRDAVRGLDFLLSARYHPSYHDYRVFPSLRQYNEAILLVRESLSSAIDAHPDLPAIYERFARAVERVTRENGIYVINWKRIPDQSSTLYSKVNLQIGRLVAGEFVGIYIVRVRGKSKVPHHFHTYLEEHHFLPERIDGLHQTRGRAARCIQSDIIYIKNGSIHAFRNDEDRDVSFLFISGSRRTGPWDFVQDITTRPELDFPKRTSADLRSVNGQNLQDVLDDILGNKKRLDVKRKLSPESVALTHSVIGVSSDYLPTGEYDLQYFVANGEGRLEMDHQSTDIRAGDVFVVPSGVASRMCNRADLILYEFKLN